MNDFTELKEWIKRIKTEPTEREKAQAMLQRLPWFRKIQRHEQTVRDRATIKGVWDVCIVEGEMIRESDGQFTAGVWSSVWKFKGKEYDFTMNGDEFLDLTIYKLEDYENTIR